MTEQREEPASSDEGLVDPASEGFALILIPEDVLSRLYTDFSAMIGTHLADHVFYQIGYRCGEVSSHQYDELMKGRDDWVDFLGEAIDQSGFGVAEIESAGRYDKMISLRSDDDDSQSIRMPGLIFAAGFIAGFATQLSDARFRCLWDVPDGARVTNGHVIHLKGEPTHEAILGDQMRNIMKGGEK